MVPRCSAASRTAAANPKTIMLSPAASAAGPMTASKAAGLKLRAEIPCAFAADCKVSATAMPLTSPKAASAPPYEAHKFTFSFGIRASSYIWRTFY